MKIWFTSLNGALTLSFIAFLIELWRGFLDFAFVYPNDMKGMEAVAATVYVVVFGLWLYGLNKAQHSSRAGVIAALVIGLLFVLGIDLGTILFYCRGGCALAAFNVASRLGVIVGTLAVVALALQLRQKPIHAEG